MRSLFTWNLRQNDDSRRLMLVHQFLNCRHSRILQEQQTESPWNSRMRSGK